LRLLAAAVAAAVGAHLLLHLAPADSPMQRQIVAHSAVAEDGRTGHGAGPAADTATLLAVRAPAARRGAAPARAGAAEHGAWAIRLCEPARPLSRVEAGVALLI
jgi:hypothetical protein